MDSFLQDIRYAIRGLGRNPGFTLIAVVALGLGIGAVTPTFSFINAYLLRPLPFEEPERLIHVWGTDRRKGWDTLRVSFPEYFDWKRQNTVFDDMAVFNYTIEDLTAGDRPEQISAGRVSANCFDVLGVQPAAGRGFSSDDVAAGTGDVVILSHRFRHRRFGTDAAVLGQTLELNRRIYTVIGVMPEEFVFPLPNTELWLPRIYDPERHTRDYRFLQVLARLKPGVSREQAQQEMDSIAGRLADQFPESSAHRGVNLVNLRSALNFADEIFRIMAVVMGAANLFVLLIACANVSSLLLSRGLRRTREVAVRAAMGASRRRLVRQFMVESVVLALPASGLGLVLAYWMVRYFAGTIPDDLYRVGQMSLDSHSLMFTLVVAGLTTLVFGLLPALRVSRLHHWQPFQEGAGTVTTGRSSLRLQNGLVAAELGLAVVLLVGSSLMVQTFLHLRRIDPGFQPEGILSMRLALPDEYYETEAERRRFQDDLLTRAQALPGVLDAGTVNYLPLNHEMYPAAYSVPGQPGDSGGETPTASLLRASPEYFKVMGIPVLMGRGFQDADNQHGPPVVLINQVLAVRLAGEEADPIGTRLQLEGYDQPRTVIGVVGNTKHWDLAEPPRAQVYVPQRQSPSGYFRIVARTVGKPMDLAPRLQQVIWDLDPNLPVSEVRSMEQVVSDFLLPQRTISGFLTGLSLGALLLAVIGVYGLMAVLVSLRTREVGIRMALGARPADILRLILGRGMALTLAGLAGGLIVSILLGRLMAGLLVGVGSLDPISFLAVPLVLAAAALLSCYFPARRAARLDPVSTLRHE